MTTIQERVIVLIKALHKSREEFAKSIGTSRTSIYDWVKRNQTTLPAILNIPEVYPEVSLEWLFRGTGDIFLTSRPSYVVEPSDLEAGKDLPLSDDMDKDELIEILSSRIEQEKKQLELYAQIIKNYSGNSNK